LSCSTRSVLEVGMKECILHSTFSFVAMRQSRGYCVICLHSRNDNFGLATLSLYYQQAGSPAVASMQFASELV
jgi:hypothetical protein